MFILRQQSSGQGDFHGAGQDFQEELMEGIS
jgi:hypothetical protein